MKITKNKFNEIALSLVAVSSTIALASNLFLILEVKETQNLEADIQALTIELQDQKNTISTLVATSTEKFVEQVPSTNYEANPETNANVVEVGAVYVTTQNVNLRNGASLDGEVIEVIHKNEEVKLLEVSANEIDGHTWMKVEASNSRGWVSSSFLQEKEVFNNEN